MSLHRSSRIRESIPTATALAARKLIAGTWPSITPGPSPAPEVREPTSPAGNATILLLGSEIASHRALPNAYSSDISKAKSLYIPFTIGAGFIRDRLYIGVHSGKPQMPAILQSAA